jgi:SET domain
MIQRRVRQTTLLPLLFIHFRECSIQHNVDALTISGSSRDLSTLPSWSIKNNVYINDDVMRFVPCRDNTIQHENSNNNIELEVSSITYGVELINDCLAGTKLLQIPSKLILSADCIKQEMTESSSILLLSKSINIIQQAGFSNHIPQFYLYLKLLQHYHLGQSSIWYEWIQSLPSTFDTAISMDETELECLPSFAYAIAKLWKYECNTFQKAMQDVPNAIVPEHIKSNQNLLRCAYDAVFTRCWCYTDNEPLDNNNSKQPRKTISRIDLVPLGDMFNHGIENIEIRYNETDFDVSVILTKDTKAGSPLLLSYGKDTNAYHFMTIFGFVDTTQQEIFAHLIPNSDILSIDVCKQLGFDPSNLVFRTSDGGISNTIWDFILYTLLEQNKQLQTLFLNAHINQQYDRKKYIHSKYHSECCSCLLNHIDRTIKEMDDLREKINTIDETTHTRLPMIRRNNDLVTTTFRKVQARLLTRIKELEQEENMSATAPGQKCI